MPFGLPFVSAESVTASSFSVRRSEELRECSRVRCSRKAKALAGDMRLLGRPSSSMVFVRFRVELGEEGVEVKERLRRDIETMFRSLRFYRKAYLAAAAHGDRDCVWMPTLGRR